MGEGGKGNENNSAAGDNQKDLLLTQVYTSKEKRGFKLQRHSVTLTNRRYCA